MASTSHALSHVKSAVGLYFALLLSFGLFFIIDDLFEAECIVGVIDAVLVGIWCIACYRVAGPCLTKVGEAKWYGIAAGLSVGTFAFGWALITVLTSVFEVEDVSYLEPIFKAGYGWPMAILLICIQPAIVEELAFRGLILPSLAETMSVNAAIVCSACLFMILHLSIPSMPFLLLLGAVLGYLRVKSGSIYPPILLHFCHNLLVLLAEGLA